MKKICVLYTTVATQAIADELAEAAVRENLAACVNCSAIHSIYRWQGRVAKEAEIALLFKTTVQQQAALFNWLKSNHPYQLPAIWWRFVEASDDFATYLERECTL